MADWIALLIAAALLALVGWRVNVDKWLCLVGCVWIWAIFFLVLALLAVTGRHIGLVSAAHAAPPDADYISGGYVYDQALFIEDGQRAVVMAGGAVVTPVAFAESLNKIIMCESGNNPEAVNPNGGATGLLQLYPDSAMLRHVREHGYTWADVTDPWVNIWLGYRWWVRTGGWRQWECKP